MNPTDSAASSNTPFKECPECGSEWRSRDDFLSDADNELVRYQLDPEDLTAGVFLFEHLCKGTMAMRVSAFRDLYDGPIFATRATGGKDCPTYCLRQHNLEPCLAECECRYVRDIIQIIKDWPRP